jgi:hypothetical protein
MCSASGQYNHQMMQHPIFLTLDFINLSLKKPALSEIAYECIQQTYDQIADLGITGACSFIAMLGRGFLLHLPMTRAG